MVEGGRHFGAPGVLHRRGGRAAVAVRVGVVPSVPERKGYSVRSGLLLCRRQAEAVGNPVWLSVAAPRRPKRYDALAGIALAPVTRWLILAWESSGGVRTSAAAALRLERECRCQRDRDRFGACSFPTFG